MKCANPRTSSDNAGGIGGTGGPIVTAALSTPNCGVRPKILWPELVIIPMLGKKL